jgi:multiple sugar transport system substrate-binding protein
MDIKKAREVLKERGVDVNIKSVGINVAADEDWKAKLALDLSSGTASDIIFIDGFWIPAFASAGYLLPLPVREWAEWDKFYPSMQWYGSYKGKIYGVIFDTDVRMLFYNKEVFKKAGLPEKWEPKTWDDVLLVSRTIKQKLPSVTPFASDITVVRGEATTMQNFEMIYLGTLPENRVKQGTWLYDSGEDKWIVNEEGLIDTLQFLRTIYVDEKLGDLIAALEAGSLDWKRRCDGIKDGKIAITLDGCWNYEDSWGPEGSSPWPNREKELGWTPMPGSGGEGTPKYACISGGWGWAINVDTKHPNLAFEVLKALESPKVLSFHNSFSTHVPPRSDVG